MCAISGVFSPGQARQMAEVLDRVGARMTRRGPDGCGQQVWDDCALNHQRLAIIDLNTGAQPMVSEDGRTAVVVNGEIYNFQALRRQLEARGHHFVSQSDSEVVLHGYREHGADIFKMLDGMFAIGIWDAARGRLLLARDRFGKKPLFWLRHGDAVWFASSVDAFKAIPGLSLSINSHAVAEYLAFRYVTDASCIYREAVKVPAGHAMRFDRDLQPETSAFAQWNDGITEAGQAGKASYAEAQEEIRRLIRNAVQKRLMSDVPLGVLLSAGIDSSIVAYEMSRAGGANRSFTLGFRGLADERAAAAETAAVFGFDHHEEQMDLDVGSDFLGEAVRTCDEPLADSSIVATHQVCAAARRHVTVALCGDGGDEAFAGYNHYRTFHQALNTQVGGIAGIGNWLRHHAAGLLPRAARRRLRGSLAPWYLAREHADPWRLWLALRCVFNPEEVQRLVGGGLNLPSPSVFHQAEAAAYDYEHYLRSDLLVKMDRASMGVALEVRAPFLDDELVRFCATLPLEWKLSPDGRGKRILRDAYGPLLPMHLWERPKQGFQVPVRRWLREGALANSVRHLMNEPRAALWDVLDHDEGVLDLKRFVGGAGNEQKIWSFVVLDEWLRSATELT
ncbi:MAG: asparagine synthase (glutamine-hydrolyzing) [Verrucomicrobiaceae bacterium]|nr:asparagine synthase (glutamine-hydrolyzing) [Verrucomicrobiaceae bacterium]